MKMTRIEPVDPAGDHHVIGVHRDIVRNLVRFAQLRVRGRGLGRLSG